MACSYPPGGQRACPLAQLQLTGVPAMAEIIDRRITAKIEGDFVVFLIGLRINKLWKIWKWLPVAMAMPRMLKELAAKPAAETGFLGQEGEWCNTGAASIISKPTPRPAAMN